MIKKKTFENQLKQHLIKHTRSNTQEKIFMDWFLCATFSEKFEITTLIFPGDQRISSRQRIIRDSGVRDSETFYREVDRKC